MARLEKDREKGVNVQVLLRCRPFNEEELLSNAPQVIVCHDSKREVSVCQSIAGKQLERTFIYDKVFGPQSQQKDLYDQAIVPIVNEVLEGFNCTIFAYGQTGTGKTYTMEGSGKRTQNEELPPDAGVIPRAIKQIFDTLELQNAEYSVKVTFLELYNEETTDLLAPEELCRFPDDKRRPLTLMEDGKGGVIVRGLEEVIVTNSTEIFNLLDRGSSKRRTAETLLNKQSSRSHSIFSITIHIKESTPEGEDLMKCGKLNLVDLAGSENICRSGAREGRAREAGEINKSLLTLGRVITSLVEHLGHVPYRDSKLTRLLRDSLGGRTKTCIIATVSPSVHCLEETMSTLDYAQRAKSIKNKPEVNQKLMKTTLIKELYAEIDRLKTELHASREKNGVYIPKDRFYQDEAEKKTMAMKIEHVEDELESNRKILEEMQSRYEAEHEMCNDLSAQLHKKQKDLKDAHDALREATEAIRIANEKVVERDFIISSQRQSESVLLEKTNDVRLNFEQTAEDVKGLFAKIDRKKRFEVHNMKTFKNFQSELAKCLNTLQNDMLTYIKQQQENLTSVDKQINEFLSSKRHFAQGLKVQIEDLKLVYLSRLQGLQEFIQSHESNTCLILQKFCHTSSDHSITFQELLHEAIVEAESILQGIQNTLTKQQNEIAVLVQQQREGVQNNILATKGIYKSTSDAFDQLGSETADIFRIIEEGGLAHEHSLSEFERNFEEQARAEEQQMLEEFTALLTESKVRRAAMIHDTVSCLREQAASARHTVKDSLNNVKRLTSEAQSGCESFFNKSEAASSEDLRRLGASHCQFEMLVQNCFKSTNDTANLWEKVQTTLGQCIKAHVPAIESIVRESKDINASLRSQIKTEIMATQEEIEAGNNRLYETLQHSTAADNEEGNTLQCSISNQLKVLATLRNHHDLKVEEMQNISHHCFADIKEDEATSLTPVRRNIHVPSKVSIDELRAPEIDIILRKYREKKDNVLTSTVKEDKLVDSENPTNKLASQVYHILPTRIPLARIN